MRQAIKTSTSCGRAFHQVSNASASTQPRAICLFCQHRATGRRALFSTTTIARDTKVEPTRNSLSQGTQPNPEQTNSIRPDVVPEPREPTGEELVIGGESLDDEAETDALAYEMQQERVNQERFQQLVDEAPKRGDYIKAATWDGLEMVGGEKEWPYGTQKEFNGFLPPHKSTDPTEVNHAIHRATVEAYLIHDARWPSKLPLPAPLSDTGDSDTRYVQIEKSADGSGAILKFPNETVRANLGGDARQTANSPAKLREEVTQLDVSGLEQQVGEASDPTAEAAAEDEAAKTATAEVENEDDDISFDDDAKADEEALKLAVAALEEESMSSQLPEIRFNKSWGQVPISNPAIKLAIIRRVAQLTGHVVPDTVVQSAATISDLSHHLIKSLHKPRSLYEELVGVGVEVSSKDNTQPTAGAFTPPKHGPLVGMANVVVSGRRVTPIDKEKVVGRWKVIEAELEKRRLPVTGRG